jgi:hypothetical protein
MIIAADDGFVVGVPTTMTAVGFFQAATEPAIAAGEREDVARRLANNREGWNAVAVGVRGYAGLSLKADKEADAVAGALADCAARDRGCRVIAIGMFSVAGK